MVKSTDMGFIDNLLNAIRNKYLNATGAERDLLTLIKDKDITQAQTLMQNRDTEVLQAIQEYNPELHRIMRKADKMRKGQEPYRTEKLPRARQKYINEVELFFLLGNPIRWKKVNNEGSDEAFEVEKARAFDPFGHAGFDPSGKIRMTP